MAGLHHRRRRRALPTAQLERLGDRGLSPHHRRPLLQPHRRTSGDAGGDGRRDRRELRPPTGRRSSSAQRVYVANWETGQVDCYDSASHASCPDFPKTMNNLVGLYTVRLDPFRPDCIWVNADHGSAQIQNFDALTGGDCPPGPIRVNASSFVAPYNRCLPTNFTSLQVIAPARDTYASGTVEFEQPNGTPIPGLPIQQIDTFGNVNLAPFGLTTKSALPRIRDLVERRDPSDRAVDGEVDLDRQQGLAVHVGRPEDHHLRRLLARRLRRRHLLLRRRQLLRLDRVVGAQPAHGGNGPEPGSRGVLAGGLRRRHLRVR